MRRRRRVLRGRAGLTLAVAASTLAAGGALAQEPSPPAGGDAPQSADREEGGTVAAVQRELGLPADGVYGRRTRAAVRRFQRREGLTVDGVIGPETLAALGISDAAAGDRGGGDASDDGTTAPDTGSGSTGSGSTDRGSTDSGSTGSASATLERIAQCESGGDPRAVSADGQYRGKYQFDRATWERLGGTGDPAQASEAEQDRLAAKLLAQRGTSPWPNCG